jgi:hypothetical protein
MPQNRQYTRLAAAYGHHDFEAITVGQHLLGKLAARHDFAVALQRDALVAKLHLLDQLGDADRVFEGARCAID